VEADGVPGEKRMWPFYSWKERRRRKLLRLFSPHLTPEIIEELVKTPERPIPSLQQAMIPYIILQVRDDDLAQVPVYMEKAFEVTLDAGGVIMSIMSSVVAVVYGIPVRIPDDESIAQRNQTLVRLGRDLGPNVRTVFGRASCLYGNGGSARRMNYGALIPDFSGSLETLLALEFGNSAEILRSNPIPPSPA
jgi:hypothetical protein